MGKRVTISYGLIAILSLLITGTTAENRDKIEVEQLSGEISLNLRNGLWKDWSGERVYQTITVDLTCSRGECQSTAWGYAPSFHQDLDHLGTVEVLATENIWRLKVKLAVQSSPWTPEETATADYIIELIPLDGKLIGSYAGDFNQVPVRGPVTGIVNNHSSQPIPNHQPITKGEHPRLIFRREEIPAIRAKIQTEYGQQIMNRLSEALETEIYYEGISPNGGSHAASHCFLALINDEPESAAKAWEIVENSLNNPGPRLLEKSTITQGIALAYDLCYQYWDETQINRLTTWLETETTKLLNGDSHQRGWNGNAWSNWNARARSAAGLAALATLGESAESSKQIEIARRNVQRYLHTALGDRGFGTEGDLYTRESLNGILPFFQAYQEVLGQDLTTNSPLVWVIPHYLNRMVKQGEEVSVPAYGRHRIAPTGDLLVLSWQTTPAEFLPAALWVFDEYFTTNGVGSFGIDNHQPHLAIYALTGYPEGIRAENPARLIPRVQADSVRGFVTWRNQWQDENDFVSSIYLKRNPLGASWSYPDVGSFRIWGLGERWAISGPDLPEPENENVLMLSQGAFWESAEPIFWRANSNGSGIITLKTNNVFKPDSDPPQGITALRTFGVDYSEAAGVPGLFVVVDRLMGAVDNDYFKNNTWIMHTPGKVEIEGNTFMIISASGATMKGTFITPVSVNITYQPTETGGVIQATGDDRFFVVMTVQSGPPPELEMVGTGLNAVKIRGQTITVTEDGINFAIF